MNFFLQFTENMAGAIGNDSLSFSKQSFSSLNFIFLSLLTAVSWRRSGWLSVRIQEWINEVYTSETRIKIRHVITWTVANILQGASRDGLRFSEVLHWVLLLYGKIKDALFDGTFNKFVWSFFKKILRHITFSYE